MPDTAGGDAEVYESIAEVLRGNREAFAAIVKRYQGLVYRLSLSYLGAAEEAEDATQEIFVRVFEACPRFRLGHRFHPWLYTIALNHLRSRRGRVLRLRSHRQEGADPEELPAAAAADELDRDRIRAAVRLLPGTLREPVMLYYLEGLSTSEVAEVLGLGVENVKSRLHRARAKLRLLLQEEEG